MKLIYIAGLEHSGTTLTDYLLGTYPSAISLGEISAFFSPSHMRSYITKWNSAPDARLCSCRSKWKKCEFWKPILGLSGLYSDEPIIEKYKKLFEYVESKYGKDTIIIDSSKSLQTLKLLIENSSFLNLTSQNLSVAFVLKDVRSFSASMLARQSRDGRKKTLLSTLRIFNYWLGANKAFLSFFKDKKITYKLNLYEHLCVKPELATKIILDGFIRNPLVENEISKKLSKQI